MFLSNIFYFPLELIKHFFKNFPHFNEKMAVSIEIDYHVT